MSPIEIFTETDSVAVGKGEGIVVRLLLQLSEIVVGSCRGTISGDDSSIYEVLRRLLQ